jgi:predicted Rossmann fold nucleotide-binding protein DprA/Smf involved in DNA uptake
MDRLLIDLARSPAIRAALAVLGPDAPHSLYALGDVELLARPTLALVCSAKAPAAIILQIHDLAQRWRVEGPVIIGGFHAPPEAEALDVLLRGPQPVIVCPARSLARMRLKPAYRAALAAGRLLMLSPFPETVRRTTTKTAVRRNRVVAALADEVLVAHAHPGSKTARLAAEVAGWGKPVWTLRHPSNVLPDVPAYDLA